MNQMLVTPVSAQTRAGTARPSVPFQADEEPAADGRIFVAFLTRHWRLLLAGCVVGSVLALMLALLVTPRYTARTLLVLDEAAQRLVDADGVVAGGSNLESRVESQVTLVGSQAVLRRAALTSGFSDAGTYLVPPGPGARLRAWIGGAIGAPEARPGDPVAAALAHLMQHTRIDRIGTSFVIAVDATAEDPRVAAQWANAIAQAYLADQLETKTGAAERARTALAVQLGELGFDLQHLDLRIDHALAEALAQTPFRSPDEVVRLEAFARLAEQQLHALQRQRGAATRDGQGELADLQTQLAAYQDAARGPHTALHAILASDLAQTGAQRLTLPDEIVRLTVEREGAEAIYRTAYERLKLAELNTRTQVAGAYVQSAARAPLEPTYPRRLPILALAFVLGGLSGGLLALLRDMRAEKVFQTGEEARPFPLPIAAALPFVRSAGRGGPMHVHRTVLDQPRSAFSEALRRFALTAQGLRHDVDAASARGALTVLFTAPQIGCGTTTLALAFALQQARAGARTLLIDADFRHPTVAGLLHLEPMPHGAQFSDLLAGNPGHRQLLDIGHRDMQTGLDVLANTRPPLELTDGLMGSDAFASLLARSKDVYDVVVIDTPALSAAVDARLLAPRASTIALCLRACETPIASAGAAIAELDRPGGPPILGLLNARSAEP